MSSKQLRRKRLGPLNKLDNNLLASIITMIPQVGRTDLNAVLRVSKRFNELATSDMLWAKLAMGSSDGWMDTVWFGRAKGGGDEAEEWLRMKEEAGLPTVNMLK